ncbi:DUF2272 domain-containing protein [Stenotrophomonas ginsengisoli]|uniref:DUF2272 domain-containing protein n=1 Tax=Stenotrophomonas ginsengisoli TaxID=336566 RepID=UPI00070EDD38|nr:DUF2272 domain-containing protein [Stenotrophomonas ginsengisoli]
MPSPYALSLLTVCVALLGLAPAASAQDSTGTPSPSVAPCSIPLPQGSSDAASRLVRTACNEHRLWHAPFIDRQGHLSHLPLTEAESGMLADDGLRAWQRVAGYWTASGTLAKTPAHPGSQACAALQDTAFGNPMEAALCRSFILDTPWSAAFISWLMRQSGLYDFPASAAHLDYISASHRGQGPYRIADPYQVRIRPGDLLCHLRGGTHQIDHAGLLQALSEGRTAGWQSHCDLVVASNPGGNRTAYLVGGNVLNAVTMRLLPINERGTLPPAVANGNGEQCSVQWAQACSLNPERWVALLQLQASTPAPQAPLADGQTNP